MADPEPVAPAEPNELNMGGAAYQKAFAKWETAYAAWQRADAAWKARQKKQHGPPPGPAPQDPFSPYERGSTSTAHDQALAITEQFLQIMGWPGGIDERALELGLLKQGLELSPERAYNWLFTQISDTLQKANPNAEFGMTQDSYVTSLNAFKDAFDSLTGSPDIPPDILRMAIDQQWTQAELTQFLQTDKRYSDPSLLPWLQQGMTFRDVKNQFFTTYGKNPVNPQQLASWFSFRQGAQQVGGGQVASTNTTLGTPIKGAPSQSEVR